jgi:peptidoglycan biosynthesis protein MviN/MurJ (putative lipid II flippase)
MLNLMAGPIVFSESTNAGIALVLSAFVTLPPYLICILIAYLLRKKVRIHPYPAALFLSCAPLALLLYGLVAIFGSDETTTFEAEETLFGTLFMSVGAILQVIGVISFVIIVMLAITERRSKNRRPAGQD